MSNLVHSVPVIIYCRTIVGLILLISGGRKLTTLSDFVEIVRGFALIPAMLTRAFAIILPFFECGTGICLISSVIVGEDVARWGGAIAMFLFAIFTVAVAINLARGRRHISCGCVGGRGTNIGLPLVLRNCGLILLAYVGLPVGAGLWQANGVERLPQIASAAIAFSTVVVWNILSTIRGLAAYGRPAESQQEVTG